jgi:outer membrane protein TolC
MSRLKRSVKNALLISLFLLPCSHSIYADTATQTYILSKNKLPLEDFLEQVSRTNGNYKSMKMNSDGASLASKSSLLLFRPQAFSNIEYTYNPLTQHAPAIQGDRNIQKKFSLGLRQQMRFGAQFQLSLEYNNGLLLGTDPLYVNRPEITNFYVVPIFNISLWQNLFGRMDQANQTMMEAQALAEAHGNTYGALATLVDAEAKYWKLAMTREAIRLQNTSLERAKRLLALEQEKKNQYLVDPSDVLLGKAAVQGKDLELKSMISEEVSAARAFNSARGIQSESVQEELILPDAKAVLELKISTRAERREDIISAEYQSIAASAGYEMAREKLLPTLNLYGSIFAFGLAFTIPLDQGSTHDIRIGHFRQGQAAEIAYARKTFEEETEWIDLVEKFTQSQNRLISALQLEEIQRQKFEAIKNKKKRGLTIAFEVFQYELDLLNASLTRLQIQGLLLGIKTQMKLYGKPNESS